LRAILYLIAKALSFPFAFFVDATGSYAFAICAIALIVKLCLLPIYAAQATQRAQMTFIAPAIIDLKKKYADSEAVLKEAMLGLYEREGVNPMTGCFLFFIQAPVLAGLLMLLRNPLIMGQSAADAAHRTFLWMADLTIPDATLSMPAITAAVTFLPLFLPIAKIIKQVKGKALVKALAPVIIFPVVMFLFSQAAPAGVAFYWAVSCVISAALLMIIAKIAWKRVSEKRHFDF